MSLVAGKITKILVIQDCTAVGGAAISLLGLVRALSHEQYEITIATNDNGVLVQKFIDAGATVFCDGWHRPLNFNASSLRFIRDLIGSLYSHIRSIYSMRNICKKVDPDIVYINTSPMLHLAPVVKKYCNAYVIYHVREHWKLRPSILVGFVRSRILKLYIDHIVTNTSVAFESISLPEKSSVVHNWPLQNDLSKSIDPFAKYNISANSHILLVPGGRIYHKGSIVAIEAMRWLKNKKATLLVLGGYRGKRSGIKQYLRKLMIICGIIPYGARMDRLVNEFGSRVKLVPYCDNIAALMNVSACVISPFTKPHFSRPAIESGALGRPIILSDCAEAREVVVHGKNGLLTPMGDARQLAEAMDAVLADSKWADMLGECARQTVELHYGLQENVAKLIVVLQKGERDHKTKEK